MADKGDLIEAYVDYFSEDCFSLLEAFEEIKNVVPISDFEAQCRNFRDFVIHALDENSEISVVAPSPLIHDLSFLLSVYLISETMTMILPSG